MLASIDPQIAPLAAAPVGLAQAMREGSRTAHTSAESTAFVQQVMTGAVTAPSYLAYLERLHAVYAELEDALDRHRHHPQVRQLHDIRLVRSPALTADLAHWRRTVGRPETARSPLRSPAVEAYVATIRRAARQPVLLIAHHYTRYLGDLSGGRILQRRLEERFAGPSGLGFYTFEALTQPVDYKRAYRDRLDGLDLTPGQRAAVVAEVCVAFDLNRALLTELDGLDATG